MKLLTCPHCESEGIFKKCDSFKGGLYECWICEQKFFITDELYLVMIPTFCIPKEATAH